MSFVDPVDVHIRLETCEVKQVVHGFQTHFLVLELVRVAHANQRLIVREGDGTPSTVAVATAGAEVGILGRQSSRLDAVYRVCIRIFNRDGAAALALSYQRALQTVSQHVVHAWPSRDIATSRGRPIARTHSGLWLEVVRKLLELGEFVVGIHSDVGMAVVASAVAGGLARLVLVSVAGGKIRRADWELALPVRGGDSV
jgi:hypothetical protein